MKTFTGLCIALFLAACGGEPQEGTDLDLVARGGVPRDGRGAFIGTWVPTSGTMSANCGNYSPETNVRSTSLAWSEGATSYLAADGGAGFCSLTAHVTGLTASALTGQGCSVSDGAYGIFSIARTGYTFTVNSDGMSAQEDSSGTVEYSESGVVSMTCAYNGNATYQKVVESPGSAPTTGPSVKGRLVAQTAVTEPAPSF